MRELDARIVQAIELFDPGHTTRNLEGAVQYAKARDINERDIVEALRVVGAAVQRLNEHGVPDLLVSYRGVLHLLEIKRPLGKRGGVHCSCQSCREPRNGGNS